MSGAEPSQWCRGGQRSEFFASDQPPLLPSQDLVRRVNIDTWTGLIAGNACPDFGKEDLVMNVPDKWGRQWLRSGEGRDWLDSQGLPRNPFFAPDRECSATDPHPILEFNNLKDGDVITDPNLPIRATIAVNNGGFSTWRLEYGTGPDPDQWTLLAEGRDAFSAPSVIYTWDLKNIPANKITLRLYLSTGQENYAERRISLSLNLPTPTPEPVTPTPFPPTDAPTNTPLPPTPTETVTPFPSDTPTVTPTNPP